MGTLKILDNSYEFKIQNRLTQDDAFQALVILMRTSSPYESARTSLLECNTEDEAFVRMKNIESILKKEYNVQALNINSLKFVEDHFELDVSLLYSDTHIKQGQIDV